MRMELGSAFDLAGRTTSHSLARNISSPPDPLAIKSYLLLNCPRFGSKTMGSLPYRLASAFSTGPFVFADAEETPKTLIVLAAATNTNFALRRSVTDVMFENLRSIVKLSLHGS